MSTSTRRSALATAIALRQPVVLWGSPGTGKTSVIEAVGADLGIPVETVIGSVCDPTDIGGLPVVDGGRVHLAPPAWAVRLVEAGRGVLFLDELTTAPPAVQAALLRVVLDRTVGDLRLPDGVAIVAAANPPEEAADGWDLAPPLANRFLHLAWDIDAISIADGLCNGWKALDLPDLAFGDEDFSASETAARIQVSGLLRVRPELVLQVPGSGESPRGWPSPRSWEACARFVAGVRTAGLGPDVESVGVAGLVGEAAEIEFRAFLSDQELPDPEALLANPLDVDLPVRHDKLWAALGSLAAAIAADPSPSRWSAGAEVVGRVAGFAPDVAMVVAEGIFRLRPEGASVPGTVGRLAPVLEAAGRMSKVAA